MRFAQPDQFGQPMGAQRRRVEGLGEVETSREVGDGIAGGAGDQAAKGDAPL
ncbi:hypothetical protein WJ966_22030 [Achromobacter xylosoxidans]